jgi:uncharacterized RmlC-like cupin family protein
MSNPVAKILFPSILDERGNLSYIESLSNVPFPIERCYWIYDVPGGAYRGGHSYKENKEVIIAMSGSFDVVITDRKSNVVRYTLNRSNYGLYIPNKTWRKLENFSTNSLALIIASSKYNPVDYLRNFDEYEKS